MIVLMYDDPDFGKTTEREIYYPSKKQSHYEATDSRGKSSFWATAGFLKCKKACLEYNPKITNILLNENV